MSGRAPQGARGLKLRIVKNKEGLLLSRPARGAWVEILLSGAIRKTDKVAPRKGRVG